MIGRLEAWLELTPIAGQTVREVLADHCAA
jgi:hypothetical protein